MQRRVILANLPGIHINRSLEAKSLPQLKKRALLDALLQWSEYDDAMRRAVGPVLFTLTVETGKAAIGEVGLDPSQFNPVSTAVMGYFQNRSIKIAEDVNAETDKQLRAALSEGISLGESIPELSARVEQVMGSAITMRADRIARTETTRAQGFADVEAWTQSGVVESKEWYTAQDERVCPFCNAMDGKTESLDQNFFDKGDSWVRGGQTQHYNYDDVPAPPLHVSCRCTLLPIILSNDG